MRSLVKVALFALLAACSVGEVPIGGGGGVDGGGGDPNAASFDSQIKPLVTECLACHSGVQQPTLTSFATLEPKYKTKPGNANIFVVKGDHQSTLYFTPAEQATVTAWIDGLR